MFHILIQCYKIVDVFDNRCKQKQPFKGVKYRFNVTLNVASSKKFLYNNVLMNCKITTLN